MNFLQRFKSLPVSSRRLLSAGIIVAFVIALPLFIWAVINLNFNPFKKAASGEPPVTFGKPIHWSTAYVKLDASDFWITVNGKKFTGSPIINIHSDPGNANYTTLEATWQENGEGMSLFMYFAADSQNWWLTEARVSDSNAPGGWIYLIQNAHVYQSPLGTPFEQWVMNGLVKTDSNGQKVAEVQFQNMAIQAFANRTASGPIPCEHLTPNLSLFNQFSTNPSPGSTSNYSVVFKNNDRGLCSYSHEAMTWTLPTNNWNVNSPISEIFTSAGDTMSFNIGIFNPPETPVNQTYYPILYVYEQGIAQHNANVPIPYYVQYYGPPTPPSTTIPTPSAVPTTPPWNYCSGPDGSQCSASYCQPVPTCTPGGICYPSVCSDIFGTCQNHVCIQVTPTPKPSCQPKPSCLDSQPPCMIPEPPSGWCGTPPPTVRPFVINFKFEGVTGDQAVRNINRANVVVKFLSQALNYTGGFVTPPLPVDYAGDGIYTLHFGIWSTYLPAATDYAITLKGDKHISTKFCYSTGQTIHCTGPGNISIPTDPITTVNLNFTGIPLQPGDVPPQDGVADMGDFSRVVALLAKPCFTLTSEEVYVGDLNYDGCVTAKDIFLIRKTLQTRYDEN